VGYSYLLSVTSLLYEIFYHVGATIVSNRIAYYRNKEVIAHSLMEATCGYPCFDIIAVPLMLLVELTKLIVGNLPPVLVCEPVL